MANPEMKQGIYPEMITAEQKERSGKDGQSIPADSLRLLFVTPRYPPLMGGVENHVYQVARRLARDGVHVTVLTADPLGQLPAGEKSEGVQIRRVRAWPARPDYYFAPDIYRVIAERNWDIVHCQSYHTFVAPLAMLAAWQAGIPYVVTFHGGGHSSRLRNMLRKPQRVMLRPLLARAERLVATARFEVGLFGRELRLPEDRFIYIPNGADLAAISPSAKKMVDGCIIASVGRLERYKGHHRVIAAMPYVLQEQPDARLWIAGEGPYEQDLRHQAQRLGIADRVEIRGVPMSEREAWVEQLSSVSLVALLSEYETHPMAALEALALGRPVLVANTSGLSELAERGLARAVSLDSTPEQVAKAILDQLRHPLVPPANIELPTWDDCAADLLSLYREIIERKQAAL